MIDLHIHTTYSDGTDSVIEILKKAQDTGLEVISITDHNTCAAYEELKNFNVESIYKGKIIVGAEFTTSFEGRIIEVLGYGFDKKQVNDFLVKYYSLALVKERAQVLYNRLLELIKMNGLLFKKENVEKSNNGNEFFEREIYKELVRYDENREILKEDIWDSFSDFYRKGLTNQESKLYMNYPDFRPSLREIIDLIHNSGGIVFLAHPYQYKVFDTANFIDRMYNKYEFDGIECFYTTFSEEQSAYLVNFAKDRRLLISGGSDYHGANKKNHELGIGRGNLTIKKNIIANWPVNAESSRNV